MRAIAVAMLGPACSLPPASGADERSQDTAREDRIRELACSGDLPVYEIWPYDVTIDWSHVTADLWDESLDPSTFETVALMSMGKDSSPELLLDSMCADDYDPPASQDYAEALAQGRTSIRTYELSFLGTHYNGSIPGSVLWLMWSSSRSPGMDIEMLAVLGVVDDGPTSVAVEWPL
jgi:hypothetical protein